MDGAEWQKKPHGELLHRDETESLVELFGRFVFGVHDDGVDAHDVTGALGSLRKSRSVVMLPERLDDECVQLSHRETTRFPCSPMAERSLSFMAGGLERTSKKRMASRRFRTIVSCS